MRISDWSSDVCSSDLKKVAELVALFPLGEPIVGEAAQKTFIKLFGSILRLKNILTAFDDFAGNEILSERDFQDYQSLYLNLHRSAERRVGKECVSTCRSRWSPFH